MNQFNFRATIAVAAFAVSLAMAAAASADTAKYPLKGRVFSANVSSAGSSGGTSVLVSKDLIGPGNVFVVQNWCTNGNSGYNTLFTGSGSGPGNFQLVSNYSCGGGMCCYTFNPGFVVGEGVDLMTFASSNNLYSNVTGIIAKKAD